MLLSIDVGVKNLAYCWVNPQGKIKAWRVIDLFPVEMQTCAGVKKTGASCSSGGVLSYRNSFFCKRHIPKCAPCAPHEFYLSKAGRRVAKKKLEAALSAIDVVDVSEESKMVIDTKRLSLLCKKDKLSVIEICKAMKAVLDQEDIESETVLIENQLGRASPLNKAVQTALTMYFVDKGVLNIKYVSPSNKLKLHGVKPSDYRERKEAAIEAAQTLVSIENPEFEDYFANAKKKDDLADAYLQAHWYQNS